MRNAPVTTATLAALCLTTGLSTTLISLATTTTTTTTAASSSLLLTHFLQQVLSVAPFSPLIIERNYWNFVSLAVVLYHLRKLERVMGSSSYFALWVVGSALGMLQGSLAAPGSNWISRTAYALPWTVPVTVLAVKYVFCLTTSCSSADRLKQHGFLYFWLLHLWVWPAVPSTYFAAAAGRFPVETISATWRVVAFASAVALGVLACTAKPNSRFQKLTLLIRRAVAEPVLQRVLRPLLRPICGPENIVQHLKPAKQQQPNGSRSSRGPGGRTHHPQVGSHQRVSNLARGGSSQFDFEEDAGAGGGAGAAAVDPAHVALLRELGINAREEEIIEALFVANGDVEHAAAILMDRGGGVAYMAKIEEELTCVVCLELLSPPCVELQPCRHVFCKECVRTLSTCPVCRATITARHDPNHLLRKLIDHARQRARCTDLIAGPQLVQREMMPQYNRRPASGQQPQQQRRQPSSPPSAAAATTSPHASRPPRDAPLSRFAPPWRGRRHEQQQTQASQPASLRGGPQAVRLQPSV